VDILPLIILLCAGGVAGFLAGFFGVGGGTVLVPLLLLFYQATGVTSLVSTHLAFGTSLLVIVFAAGAATLQQSRNSQVVWKAALLLGAGSAVGALAGAFLAGGLEGRTLRQFFAVILVAVAVQLLMAVKKRKGEQVPALFPPALLLGGVVVGLVSALAGVGGGIIAIPLMHSVFRFPFKKALATSSATIMITACAAGVGYVISGWGNSSLPPLTLGFVDYVHAVPLILGSVPLAIVGAKTVHTTEAKRLTTIFAVLLIVVAFRMFFF
jgi:uncharacterized membrane protein YfcA